MKNINTDTMEDILIDYVGVPEEAVTLVTKINGITKHVFEDILFVYTGYQDFEQYLEEVGYEQ